MDPWIMPMVSFVAGLMGSVSAFFYGYGRLSAKIESLAERMEHHTKMHEHDVQRMFWIQHRLSKLEGASAPKFDS